jgi:hypothetical protein
MGEKVMLIKMVNFADKVPRCTDKPTYDNWRDIARHLPPTPKVGFCEDCTLDYQIAMKAQKRCENPWITFEQDEDGFERGVIPRETENA